MPEQAKQNAKAPWKELVRSFMDEQERIRAGGGPKAVERQHAKGRLTARERIELLIDDKSFFQELGLWYAHGMYAEQGGAPAAGVVTGIGKVHDRSHIIIANDATVKAGAFFPMTCKKIIRAQTIARMARLPLIYLVDSAGVFLPLQEDVFPDTDDFGRIFYLNSVISAEGIPQIAAIMGYCVAGGGYLPVLCDTLLMTEGSGLYLAGPALVKAAIGQEVSDEELGGAEMHAAISGTIDFKEVDDEACLRRVRAIASEQPRTPAHTLVQELHADLRYMSARVFGGEHWDALENDDEEAIEKHMAERYGEIVSEDAVKRRMEAIDQLIKDNSPRKRSPIRPATDVYEIFTSEPGSQYDIMDILACVVDSRATPNEEGHETLTPDVDEYKADYGKSIVCAYAKIGGHPVGIVANQGKLTEQSTPGGKAGPSTSTNMPRVIYEQAADKAARFIMGCNQAKIPLIFLHDTTGFMVGRDSEQAGIIRSGAKMVNAMSNCVVPKIVVIMGGSYGAGNYAMCGRAFEQFLSFAWPGANCAVMGAAQATGTLAMIEERSRERKGEEIDAQTHKQILDAVRASYNEQQDIRYGAARGWVDRIIEPHRTREELIGALEAARGWDWEREFKTGVLQT